MRHMSVVSVTNEFGNALQNIINNNNIYINQNNLSFYTFCLTYILITRFGPMPIFTAVITKCNGVGSSHNSFFDKLESLFINV